MNNIKDFLIFMIALFSSSRSAEAAISLLEVGDWSDSHLAPTEISEPLGLGFNTLSGSIGQVPFDSDSFIIRNPFGLQIDSIMVSISNLTWPIYPEGEPIVSLLPGVIVVAPNHVGLVPWEDGTFPLTTDYTGSGDLVLADESALLFSIFMDENPAIALSGGFDYELQITTSAPEVAGSVPEPSAALLGALGGFALLRRRRVA